MAEENTTLTPERQAEIQSRIAVPQFPNGLPPRHVRDEAAYAATYKGMDPAKDIAPFNLRKKEITNG